MMMIALENVGYCGYQTSQAKGRNTLSEPRQRDGSIHSAPDGEISVSRDCEVEKGRQYFDGFRRQVGLKRKHYESQRSVCGVDQRLSI